MATSTMLCPDVDRQSPPATSDRFTARRWVLITSETSTFTLACVKFGHHATSRLSEAPSVTHHAAKVVGVRRQPIAGISHLPDLPERKIASITAIFPIAFSTGTGTSPPSSTALEKASPCSVY